MPAQLWVLRVRLAVARELVRRVGRRDANETTQDLADLAKIQRRIEAPNEVEHIAPTVGFGRGLVRIPPTTVFMVDDDDFAVADRWPSSTM